uniref:ATP synthase complex subunit 8 n=1 Tax=Plecotus macrobullaris TaxID=242915 RepID=A0A0M4MJH2_9CHIR|nr:ATP synthase F0 subunit 8 [Plecotus macrobullaris]ALE32861.1 ATP synthase F0 subunit 8 [Plecotus macrobullaris]ALE32874.1 ATP synthase F0 subunit 8 [Plecotus macrobullaris]ALE32887.1 ATP synthase F0 subunit 8 [Plecotus macrobullaris]ALE32900.1 ATP synthase F0 subunit 8 [Plecotus macrobullaris]ALE32913.1 ATP synthase F0 subunit 8 [Plecotus macrobullaris]
MPQLNTSTWPITIMSMIMTLFIMFQLKISKHLYHLNPAPLTVESHKYTNPWEIKWTKIYLPLSLPLR